MRFPKPGGALNTSANSFSNIEEREERKEGKGRRREEGGGRKEERGGRREEDIFFPVPPGFPFPQFPQVFSRAIRSSLSDHSISASEIVKGGANRNACGTLRK
jgi:hypothetical protein